jgi:menaquinone-dependent protoporphyrinogen IX oxidase
MNAASLYEQLTQALLSGNINAAQNLITQGSRQGQTGAIATALSTASANVRCFCATDNLQLKAGLTLRQAKKVIIPAASRTSVFSQPLDCP